MFKYRTFSFLARVRATGREIALDIEVIDDGQPIEELREDAQLLALETAGGKLDLDWEEVEVIPVS